MPNPKYEKGKRLERNIVNHAISKGMFGLRSAGSKSPIDVVLVDEKHRKIYTIQGKAKKLSQNASNKLLATLPRQDEYMLVPLIISNLKEFKEFIKEQEEEEEQNDTTEK
jgi:Holliday junction resolvase